MYISMHSRCGISYRNQVPSLTNQTPCTFSSTGILECSTHRDDGFLEYFSARVVFHVTPYRRYFGGPFGDEGSYLSVRGRFVW